MTISRQGLTHCPNCRTYVRASDDACIGCGATLDARSDGALTAMRRRFARTRGGVIAASLLGLSALWGGCGDDNNTPPRDVAPEFTAGDAAYGLPPFDLSVDTSLDAADAGPPKEAGAEASGGGDGGAG